MMRRAAAILTGMLLIPIAILAGPRRPVLPDGFTTPGAPQSVPPATPTADYTFPTGAGILFFYVKPDKTVDFEAVVARLSEALGKAADPQLKQQAEGWHMLRSVETIKDAAVYVFVFDPAVVGADYDPVKVLRATVPSEFQGLYAELQGSVIRVERMGLVKLR